MCEHEEVLDSEGYVCIKCGVVLDQEYVYGDNCFYNETDVCIDHNSNSIICTILEHLNLNQFSCKSNCWNIIYLFQRASQTKEIFENYLL